MDAKTKPRHPEPDAAPRAPKNPVPDKFAIDLEFSYTDTKRQDPLLGLNGTAMTSSKDLMAETSHQTRNSKPDPGARSREPRQEPPPGYTKFSIADAEHVDMKPKNAERQALHLVSNPETDPVAP